MKDEEEEAESEWICKPESLHTFLTRHLVATERSMLIGCGNSRMGEWLYEMGFHNQVNTDISKVSLLGRLAKRTFWLKYRRDNIIILLLPRCMRF